MQVALLIDICNAALSVCLHCVFSFPFSPLNSGETPPFPRYAVTCNPLTHHVLLPNLSPTGPQVYAIGNPFGLDHTLTVGVVSGTGREIGSMSDRPIEVRAGDGRGQGGGKSVKSNDFTIYEKRRKSRGDGAWRRWRWKMKMCEADAGGLLQ